MKNLRQVKGERVFEVLREAVQQGEVAFVAVVTGDVADR